MCAIRLPHINMLTFYTVLIIYNHHNKIQSKHFCVWLLYERINKVMSFCTWFWPKVIHIGKEANYPQKQPHCTYQCKYIVPQIAVPDVASKSWPKTGAFTTYCSNNVIRDNKSQMDMSKYSPWRFLRLSDQPPGNHSPIHECPARLPAFAPYYHRNTSTENHKINSFSRTTSTSWLEVPRKGECNLASAISLSFCDSNRSLLERNLSGNATKS